MVRVFQPLFFYLASCTENQLVRHLEFLKAENEMLRKRVPGKRIFLEPAEKKRLIELGQTIGAGVKHLITVVSYGSYLRWIREAAKGYEPKKMGRRKTADELCQLILTMAKENDWGYTRIMGELKKLGIKPPSRNTVKNILKANGHDPDPKTGKGSWDEFLKMHAETLYQCDFFSKKIWTPTGLRQYFVLAFLHVGSRTVFVTKASRKPDAAWMKEQAEAFVEHVESEGRKCEKLIRDYDNMFSTEFEEIIKTTGAEIKKVGPRAANMNAFVERWVQSIQQECLDHFIVFGEDHFNYLVSEWVEHYHAERPHQNMGNKPLAGEWPDEGGNDVPEVVCKSRLGGLLKHYDRKAA